DGHPRMTAEGRALTDPSRRSSTCHGRASVRSRPVCAADVLSHTRAAVQVGFASLALHLMDRDSGPTANRNREGDGRSGALPWIMTWYPDRRAVNNGEVRAGEPRASEVRAGQVGAVEARVGQVGAVEVRAGQVGAVEVRVR